MERGASGERKRVSSLVLRRPGSEFGRLPSSIVEDINDWSYTSAVPMRLPSMEWDSFYRELTLR